MGKIWKYSNIDYQTDYILSKQQAIPRTVIIQRLNINQSEKRYQILVEHPANHKRVVTTKLCLCRYEAYVAEK